MYCWSCGRSIESGLTGDCSTCGAPLWDNLIPGSSAIVEHGQKVLLVRRKMPPWQGTWDIPGGFCEAYEHPACTAAREVLEETGLSVQIVSLLGMWVGSYEDGRHKSARATLDIYYMARTVGDVALVLDPDEISDACWFRVSELPSLADTQPNAHRALEAWIKARIDQS